MIEYDADPEEVDLDSAVKDLVVKTLGCKCSPDVLKTVEWNFPKDGLAGLKLVIGKRLLIRAIPLKTMAELSIKQVVKLLRTGRKERDKRGLNRFRLVLVGTRTRKAPWGLRRFIKKVQRRLSEMKVDDEKLHLHAIGIGEVPAALRRLFDKR